MCRMLFACGNFNPDWIIQDFILMANDQNEKHEKNQTCEFKHGDGWGIVFRKEHELQVFKSPRPVYEDDRIDQFRALKTDLVILHARKASKGAVEIKNVHPFVLELSDQRFLFCHNGTVRDPLPFESGFVPQGSTDSEALLYFIASLGGMPISLKSLRSKLEGIQDFTAANFMLTDGKTSYFACWHAVDPIYYTLKMLKSSDFICISSEILPHYRHRKWQPLDNKSIILLQDSDFSVVNG